jgi:hypothetical protein
VSWNVTAFSSRMKISAAPTDSSRLTMLRMLLAKPKPRSEHNASQVGPKIENTHTSA